TSFPQPDKFSSLVMFATFSNVLSKSILFLKTLNKAAGFCKALAILSGKFVA
ncbi:32701_t:CDS:2, partial [Gigaspora margarita]